MWLLAWCFLVQAIATKAAYYHEKSVTIIEPPEKLLTDSFFGYSIAFENNRVVVSAPRADEDGQVYSCGLAMNNCTRMNIAVDANRNESSYYHNHNFWLGATVKSDDKHLFVCAPRSTSSFRLSPSLSNSIFITAGSCYYKDLKPDSNFHQMSQISPSDRRIGYSHIENLTDSFGWSMDIDTQGALRVGSPAIAAGRVMTYSSLSEPNPTLFRSPYPHGYNFGYSIASGVFKKTLKKRKPDIAIGTPSGTGNGIGRVLFYENDQKKSLGSVADPADTVGSMFGASLCAAHIDGVTTSLLVGAPAHFTGDSYHTGIVYVYRHKIKNMELVKKIEGPNKNGAFFGYAIANVGDMDRDGKDEIVIAAPYEDDGAGAVYLYAGSSLLDHNTELTWIQRFQPSKFINFGLSLAANKYSGNGCEELAIGAPGNDKVAVYHCLTVITVTVETTKPDLKNRADKSSFAFDLCLKATYPSKPKNIQAQFEVKVQITHPNATLTDAVAPNDFIKYNETLNNLGNPVGCRKINVTTSENGDYEQEIEFNITAKLVDDPNDSNEFNASKATISSHSKLSSYLTLRAAECKGETCEPELSVKLKSNVKSPYVIGSTKTVGVDVSVSNANADTAYRPCVRVNVSGDVTIRRAPENCKFDGDRQRICQLQKPLKANRTWDVTSDQSIELDLTYVTSKSNKIQITAEVLNRCEASLPGNATSVTVTIDLKTNIDGVNIKSKTDEGMNGTIKLNSEDIKQGKIIHHTYRITNTGEINWIGIYAEFWLYTASYIAYKHPVQIYSGETPRAPCPLQKGATSNGGFYALNCELGDLLRKETITVVIPITTLPVLHTMLEKSNATVKTFLRVAADPYEKNKEELTTLVLHKASVPIWIIIVASAVGILLVALIAFALRECGFLRREKKKELEDLQKEVKRKSQMVIRQSTRLTDSARAELRNKRMTYRELLDDAAKKEAEEAEEVGESFGQARSSDENNIDQANGLDNNAKSPLNGSSSVSSLDFRAQLEKAVKRGSKGNKSDETPLWNDKEI